MNLIRILIMRTDSILASLRNDEFKRRRRPKSNARMRGTF